VTRVVILGGGFGGVATAVALAGTDCAVTLIDRLETNYLAGDNPFVVVGGSDRAPASRRLSDIGRFGVRFVEAEIDRIDVAEKAVMTSAGEFDFDYLVVSLGATYDWDAVPGSYEAHSFYELERAERLRDRLLEFEGGTIVLGVGGKPIKCPPAPFEMMMLIDWWLRRHDLRDESELHIAIPGPAPLAVAGPEPSRRMQEALELRDISVHTGASVTEVGPTSMVFSDGQELATDVAITVPVHQPPAVVTASGLVGEPGWVQVDRATLETSFPGVFAIGDVNTIPVGGRTLPKSGVFASGEGRAVAAVISARVGGAPPPEPYDGVGHCFVAFSGEEGARVGGNFFMSDVELDRPSVDGMRDKERFGTAWRTFLI
jgi:sulfide:quinone oxidoreductase